MPPKRKGGKKHNSKPTTTAAAAISDLSLTSTLPSKNLPTEIIALILKRLPVKSILRFKCVSKPWRALLSSSKFISMHRDQTSKNPHNHSFIIHSSDEDLYHYMSLLNIYSTATQPISLVIPFPVLFKKMDFVGSLNGVVCLSSPPVGHMIVLWNPAMNLYKYISLSGREVYKPGESPEKISLGLAYDSVNEDIKIIRIVCLKPQTRRPESLLKVRVEVYSANLDSWRRVFPIDPPFFLSASRNNVIAKGIPYWIGIMYEATTGRFPEVLLYYDMPNDTFKHVPLPEINGRAGTGIRFVEWKGNLGVIVFSPGKDMDNFVDILVYDEKEICWNKVSSHGPMSLKVERHMQCSKDGVILAETPEGKLILYDRVTNGIKEFCIPEAEKLSFEAFSYAESLISFKKMEQVKEQNNDKFCLKHEYLNEDAAALYMKSWMKMMDSYLDYAALNRLNFVYVLDQAGISKSCRFTLCRC